jgi:uncharacterized protein involved in exopolysaccharide biosynthesis
LQSTKFQPAIQVTSNRRRALAVSYKEQPLVWKAADVLFRHWRWTLAIFALVTIGVAGYAALSPREYESEMTFLVNNNRTESMSGADGNAPVPHADDVTDQQMSTEVQILSSRDLSRTALSAAGFHGGSDIEQERALDKLQKNLQVSPVLKANMIRVRYSAPSPNQAVEVLEALAAAYPEQHLQLHGNPGEMGFFDSQAADADKKLKDAENQLLVFQQESGVVSASDQKQMLLTRQIELQVALHQAEAELQDAVKRVASIKPRVEAMSKRIDTQTRRLPNQYSVERLNTMLTELQNRRTELVSKYRPGERIVTQLDQQIADTKKALQSAEGSVATEQVSDVNPLREGLETELERAQATQAGLEGRIQAMKAQVAAYRGQLARLETLAPREEELQRNAKVAESNYMLYAKKREEARISQRMDEQKIANVVLAEQPRFPVLPKSRAGFLAVMYALGLLVGALLVGLISRMRQTIETPWALEEIASVPVLGTVPVHSLPSHLDERLRRSA